MKRIVIACDGTWSRLDAARQTNVAKLAEAVLPVAADGTPQIVCHVDGVGTGRGTGRLSRLLDRALGGAAGVGLEAALAEAYRFLVLAYAPGDQVMLFGFSRGAFTARSLAGLIRTCGILSRREADAIPAALDLYRRRDALGGADGETALAFRAARAAHVATGAEDAAWRGARGLPPGVRLRIGYLGVWDTVGALGVPAHLWLAPWLNRGLRFHDTSLSSIVAAARHAVAIDERRRLFPPTLWGNLDALNAAAPDAYAQRWFPGDHGSVGGGGAVTALSDDALLWVAEGATAAGLGLDPEAVAAWARNRDWRAPLTGGARGPVLRRLMALDSRDRSGPATLRELADAAVRRWCDDPGYRPAALARVAAALDAASGIRPADRPSRRARRGFAPAAAAPARP